MPAFSAAAALDLVLIGGVAYLCLTRKRRGGGDDQPHKQLTSVAEPAYSFLPVGAVPPGGVPLNVLPVMGVPKGPPQSVFLPPPLAEALGVEPGTQVPPEREDGEDEYDDGRGKKGKKGGGKKKK